MSIEELAFKDRKILANLNAVDLLDIIEFLQEDRNQWINQFTKTHNEGVEIQKENQQLKEALETKSYCKYANKCDELDDCSREEYETMAIENIKLSIENQGLKEKLDKYENPKDMTLMMMWCTEKVKDENLELKKQLEDKNEKIILLQASEPMLNYKKALEETQQKKFIDYLENEIKRLKENDIYEPLQRIALATHQYNLSKYKKIIGVSE